MGNRNNKFKELLINIYKINGEIFGVDIGGAGIVSADSGYSTVQIAKGLLQRLSSCPSYSHHLVINIAWLRWIRSFESHFLFKEACNSIGFYKSFDFVISATITELTDVSEFEHCSFQHLSINEGIHRQLLELSGWSCQKRKNIPIFDVSQSVAIRDRRFEVVENWNIDKRHQVNSLREILVEAVAECLNHDEFAISANAAVILREHMLLCSRVWDLDALVAALTDQVNERRIQPAKEAATTLAFFLSTRRPTDICLGGTDQIQWRRRLCLRISTNIDLSGTYRSILVICIEFRRQLVNQRLMLSSRI